MNYKYENTHIIKFLWLLPIPNMQEICGFAAGLVKLHLNFVLSSVEWPVNYKLCFFVFFLKENPGDMSHWRWF